MSEPSKFAGALLKLNKGKEPTETQPEIGVEILPVTEKAKVGRPQGKRSDPDFQQTTLLLRKETKKKSVRKLEDAGGKMDLSELVEQLLTDWNTKQS